MTESIHGDALPEDVIDAAITWAIKLDYSGATREVQHAFQQWLDAHVLHALAWRRVHSLKGLNTSLVGIPSRLALETLQTVDAQRQKRLSNRRNAMKLLSFAGMAAAAGWVIRDATPWQRLLADVSTAVGEQKTVTLADGTVVMLNTDSAISTDLSGDRRLIVLRRGEILITTGPDSNVSSKRPFWVYTPFGKLQALGTRFTVRLDDDRAGASVQEGAVELHPANLFSPRGASFIVHAGESRWLNDDGTAPTAAQGFDENAWVDGVIAGKNMRMADLLSELSRYRSGRIVCDERVADLRISGTFHLRRTNDALHFLAQTQPVSVTYHTRFWVAVGPPQ